MSRFSLKGLVNCLGYPQAKRTEATQPPLANTLAGHVMTWQSPGGPVPVRYLGAVGNGVLVEIRMPGQQPARRLVPGYQLEERRCPSPVKKAEGWVTLEPSGTHVFLEGGKVTAGPAGLTGHPVNRLSGEKKPGKKPGRKPDNKLTNNSPQPSPTEGKPTEAATQGS